MPLTERSRSVLYQGLAGLIEDEVAVGELLSYFPARDVEEPATKEFVAGQAGSVRAEMTELRHDLRAEMASLRSELTADMVALRAEVTTEMQAVRSDMDAGLAALRSDMDAGLAALRVEMAAMEARLTAQASAQLKVSIQWTLGALVSVMGLMLAMGFLQGP